MTILAETTKKSNPVVNRTRRSISTSSPDPEDRYTGDIAHPVTIPTSERDRILDSALENDMHQASAMMRQFKSASGDTPYDPIVDENFTAFPVITTRDYNKKPVVKETEVIWGHATNVKNCTVTRNFLIEPFRNWEWIEVKHEADLHWRENPATVIVWNKQVSSCDCCDECQHGEVCWHMQAVAQAFGFDNPQTRGDF